jgi:hypothetical protein
MAVTPKSGKLPSQLPAKRYQSLDMVSGRRSSRSSFSRKRTNDWLVIDLLMLNKSLLNVGRFWYLFCLVL